MVGWSARHGERTSPRRFGAGFEVPFVMKAGHVAVFTRPDQFLAELLPGYARPAIRDR